MPVAPPRPKGPPLNALRAFEAASRLGGFTTAAQELSVTPGAVAQQIKSLEEWAGARLFERHAQGVRLTALGQSVREDFTLAFDHMGQAVQALRSRAKPQHLRIATLPSLAQLWVSQRLPAIRAQHPDITLSITAIEHRPNLMREPYDLSLFYVEEPLPQGCIAIERDEIYPVCAPHLASRLTHLEDLKQATLLHDSSWAMDWRLWLDQAECTFPADVASDSGPVFSLYSLAVQEALNGAGVLIGHAALIRHHLEDGSLVRPFSHALGLDRHLVAETSDAAARNGALTEAINALVAS